MRIRKNAKLSPVILSHGGSARFETTFQSHECQLNQSPWDVIPFGSDSYQVEAENLSAGSDASHGDSIGAPGSVIPMMDIDRKQTMVKIEDMAIDDEDTPPPKHFIRVQKSSASLKGGKHNRSFTSQKNRDRRGQSLRNRRYPMLKPWSNLNDDNGCHSKKTTLSATSRRACSRTALKKSSSSSSCNPHEFYYYSGFGPSWGRRRGDRNVENSRRIDGAETAEGASDDDDDDCGRAYAASVYADVNGSGGSGCFGDSTSSSPVDDDGEFDVSVDGEEEDAGDGGGSGKKKRVRKPVKARSLKSLM